MRSQRRRRAKWLQVNIVPVPGTQFEETLAAASADLLRKMLRGFAQRMMDAEVAVRCQVRGARRSGSTPATEYRRRERDTRDRSTITSGQSG